MTTPIPWTVVRREDRSGHQYADIIAEDAGKVVVYYGKYVTREDAELIVRAANSYAAYHRLATAALALESELGRPDAETIARVLGVGENALTEFWAAVDDVKVLK